MTISPDNKKKYMREYRKKNKDKLNKNKLIATKAKRVENKLRAIQYLGGECSRCNGVFDPCVYDFHHKDPSNKSADPGSLLHCSWETVFEEVSKCILLCSNCHRIIHKEDQYV